MFPDHQPGRPSDKAASTPCLRLRPGFRHLLTGRSVVAPPLPGGGVPPLPLQPLQGLVASEEAFRTALGGVVTLTHLRWGRHGAPPSPTAFPHEVLLAN